MSQRFIAIETSSPRLSLALGTENGIQQEYQGPLAWRHAESLFAGMQKILKQAHWPIQSLTGVMVSLGPGSFTGIRIGLAVARALGQSLKIPVKGFSSLETLAQPLHRPGRWVSPVIDALRGEVFTVLYRTDAQGRTKKILKEARVNVAAWVEMLRDLKQPVWVTGDGLVQIPKPLRDTLETQLKAASLKDRYPHAGALLELGQNGMRALKPDSYQSALPMYLRRAAAQERRLQR